MSKARLQQLLCFLICLILVVAVSIRRDRKVLGYQLDAQKASDSLGSCDTLRTLEDGTVVVNTTSLASDIQGYGGAVPLEISIKDGIVVEVLALENQETPGFFRKASVLLDSWNGLSIAEAQRLEVDAVSGATFTSKAIIGNVRLGLAFASKQEVKHSIWKDFDTTVKGIVGLIVALMAAILPLFVKNRRYRTVQQLLNIAVLGFWCGTFINYSSLVGYLSSGINLVALLIPCILLITAFVYPLFGKPYYYCANVCPFGSLQELAGRCVGYKLKIAPKTLKRLDQLRQLLWAALMLCLWTGVWYDWMDYEPFSAFIFQSASWIVIAIAIVFVALSTVIMRPYCRFVCPTGTLMKFSQMSFKK